VSEEVLRVVWKVGGWAAVSRARGRYLSCEIVLSLGRPSAR
jgi:hypothetical protein